MAKTTEQQEFRVLKSGTCPSLSGRSKLAYDIACDNDNNLHVRVLKNSGGGYFSPCYVTWVQIVAVSYPPRSLQATVPSEGRVRDAAVERPGRAARERQDKAYVESRYAGML